MNCCGCCWLFPKMFIIWDWFAGMLVPVALFLFWKNDEFIWEILLVFWLKGLWVEGPFDAEVLLKGVLIFWLFYVFDEYVPTFEVVMVKLDWFGLFESRLGVKFTLLFYSLVLLRHGMTTYFVSMVGWGGWGEFCWSFFLKMFMRDWEDKEVDAKGLEDCGFDGFWIKGVPKGWGAEPKLGRD